MNRDKRRTLTTRSFKQSKKHKLSKPVCIKVNKIIHREGSRRAASQGSSFSSYIENLILIDLLDKNHLNRTHIVRKVLDLLRHILENGRLWHKTECPICLCFQRAINKMIRQLNQIMKTQNINNQNIEAPKENEDERLQNLLNQHKNIQKGE